MGIVDSWTNYKVFTLDLLKLWATLNDHQSTYVRLNAELHAVLAMVKNACLRNLAGKGHLIIPYRYKSYA